MWTLYLWEINDEESEFCGEQFFTELEDATKEDHRRHALIFFPNEKIHCLGRATEEEAEWSGLDIY